MIAYVCPKCGTQMTTDEIRDGERFLHLNEQDPDVARIMRKAKVDSGWIVTWDRADRKFWVADEALHNFYYAAETLEEIERFFDGRNAPQPE